MFEGKDIICVSLDDWDENHASVKHLMTRFASKNRILYVENQLSIAHLFRSSKIATKLMKKYKSTWLGRNAQQVQDSIYVYSPEPMSSFSLISSSVHKLSQGKLLESLRKQIEYLGFSNPILWVYSPYSSGIPKNLNECLSIYHCTNDYSNSNIPSMMKRLRKITEDELTRKSDIIFASADHLMQTRGEINKNVYMFPSAVDYDHFVKATDSTATVPEVITDIPKPRICYVGTIDQALDIDLMTNLSLSLPNCSFVIMGIMRRDRPDFHKLIKQPNVFFLGKIEYELVPSFLKGVDICLIPYVVNEFTRSVSPLKLYEYMAAGKPVISTPLPEVKKYSDAILISHDLNSFLKHIDFCLNNQINKILDKANEVVQQHTWDARVDGMSRIISNFLSNKF